MKIAPVLVLQLQPWAGNDALGCRSSHPKKTLTIKSHLHANPAKLWNICEQSSSMTPSGVFHPGNNLGKKNPSCLVAAHCPQIFLSFQINFVISAAPNSSFWSFLFVFLQLLLFASIYGPTQERQSSVSSRENTQPYLHICKLREIWRNSGNGDGLWGWKTECQWGEKKNKGKRSPLLHIFSPFGSQSI